MTVLVEIPLDGGFVDSVDASDLGPCEEWQGSRTLQGYGRIGRAGKRAHRMVWEQAYGPIPAGMFVCHRCDNPPCVKLSHLFLGTPADNMADKVRKGRQAKGLRTRPETRAKGARNGSVKLAKLTAEDVRKARALSASGVPLGVLASRFGVHKGTIHDAIRRRTWRHVQ